MEKKLPDIFANPIDKTFENTQDTFYGSGNEPVRVDKKTIEQKINTIFASKDFVYKSKVRIETNHGTKICNLIGKTNHSLLTLENETIAISDILNIEKI